MSPAARRRPYKYAYGICDGAGGEFFKDIAKVDVESGEVVKWGRRACFVGEGIFVPDPNGKAEGDGCLLVPELDGNAQRSSLVVLDARRMSEITRATLPYCLAARVSLVFLVRRNGEGSLMTSNSTHSLAVPPCPRQASVDSMRAFELKIRQGIATRRACGRNALRIQSECKFVCPMQSCTPSVRRMTQYALLKSQLICRGC